jgi:hypothetical protein
MPWQDDMALVVRQWHHYAKASGIPNAKTGKRSKAATASSRTGSKPHEISYALLTAIGTLTLFTFCTSPIGASLETKT